MNGRRAPDPRLVLALAVGVGVTLAVTLLGERLAPLDRAILVEVARARAPWLTNVATNVTALGSVTLVVLFTLVGLVVLGVRRARVDAAQLAASTTLALLAQGGLKRLLRIERPVDVEALVEATGWAYPSGHALSATALLITLATLVRREARDATARTAAATIAAALIAAIALSRVYLGVHRPSEVAGGVALGAAVALLVDLAFVTRAARAGRAARRPDR